MTFAATLIQLIILGGIIYFLLINRKSNPGDGGWWGKGWNPKDSPKIPPPTGGGTEPSSDDIKRMFEEIDNYLKPRFLKKPKGGVKIW